MDKWAKFRNKIYKRKNSYATMNIKEIKIS